MISYGAGPYLALVMNAMDLKLVLGFCHQINICNALVFVIVMVLIKGLNENSAPYVCPSVLLSFVHSWFVYQLFLILSPLVCYSFIFRHCSFIMRL